MRATLIAMVLVTSVSLAAGPRDPLAAAANAMAEADFDKAMALLDAALPKAKGNNAVKIQLMRGEALVALQRIDDAINAFGAALAIDPSAALAPSSASPDAVNAMSKARRQVMSDLLVVIANGAKANLRLDDNEMGPAPLKTRVGAGLHVIEAVGSHGEKVSRKIDVAPGRPLELTLELPAVDEPLPPPPMPPPAVTTSESAASTTVTTSHPGGSKIGLVPIAIGAAVLGGGVACLVLANGNHGQLTDLNGPHLDSATELRLAAEGSTFQTVGFAGIGIGIAAAATGTAMLLFFSGSNESTAHAVVVPSANGGYFGLAGSFEEVQR